ncbi:hypothetical protein ACYE2N_10175 [Flavobacterium sp. MAHUQ-51]|uniref:hypothetical protein n=1 Tax=Flavobacterium sp. GCM10022190 TaxID=3252639 RepID=UPI00360A2CA7
MKKYSKYIAILLILLFLITSLISCGVYYNKSNPSGKIPPGQAKKMTGSKSAKYYAPGQNK